MTLPSTLELVYLDTASIQSVRETPLWWQKQGLQQTASGYGKKLTTGYMVRVGNRWRRVYCVCYSNNGSLYVLKRGQALYLDSDAAYLLKAAQQ